MEAVRAAVAMAAVVMEVEMEAAVMEAVAMVVEMEAAAREEAETVAAMAEAVMVAVVMAAVTVVATAVAATVVVMAGSQKPRQHSTARHMSQMHHGSCKSGDLSPALQRAARQESRARTLPTSISAGCPSYIR